MFVIVMLIVAIVCFILAGIINMVDEKDKKVKRDYLILITDNAIKESGLVIDNWDNIKSDCQKNTLEYTQDIANRINRLIQFTTKYVNVLSEDELTFVGMTEEMLVESVGNPTKIEEEVMKTKTKKTYIYGNKNSGDILVFEQGKLVRFKDR